MYIVVSGQIAAGAAASVEELRDTERLKGLLFVGSTAVLLFWLAFWLFRRLQQAADEVVRTREAFVAAQRRETAGLLAASIAHDFNNLLTVLGYGVGKLRGRVDGDAAKLLDEMEVAVERGSALARRLSKAGMCSAAGEAADVDVVATAREAVDLVMLHRRARGCTFEVESDGPVMARVYPALVHQIVTNLVLNAVDAVGGHGTIRTEVAASDAGDDVSRGVVIEVHDSGPGIPPHLRERVFEPFYTTKPSGTGLGLLSVQTCARMHRGSVEVLTSPLGGALFRVHLGQPA